MLDRGRFALFVHHPPWRCNCIFDLKYAHAACPLSFQPSKSHPHPQSAVFIHVRCLLPPPPPSSSTFDSKCKTQATDLILTLTLPLCTLIPLVMFHEPSCSCSFLSFRLVSFTTPSRHALRKLKLQFRFVVYVTAGAILSPDDVGPLLTAIMP